MKNYDTFTFTRASHYNEFCPDTKVEFTTHQEEDLDSIVRMFADFLVVCSFSSDSIKRAMNEFGEE